MYTIGSKVVHPCHGAGIVVRIQEKSISETSHAYYVIDTVSGAMRLMVPVQRADTVGLRYVGKAARLRNTLATCGVAPGEEEIEKDFRARQAVMREQLKSGSFERVSYAVRILFFINQRRTLGMSDRQLLEQGKGILAGELALASDQDVDIAMQEVEDHLAQMLEVEDEE